ncbi:hypothetical protein BDV40DRAFT_311544 [Aspergillus tamarii]|uniref:Glucose-methanol-choline oxidoreductase C-terminal domain-containing protein n=1 Tax=Aspergillus tamarii TaxID=41984 RepID=A0A5N6UZB7_ASPTM|nr:hypothetical protein BDV40DRAFT_311544 [Aspergillus tamarii]
MTTLLLPQKADYIIIGGGTASLVVVLESGPDRTTDSQVQDSNAWSTLSGSEFDWQLKIAGLNNREQDHPAGKMLGGSSALNGLAEIKDSPVIKAWNAAIKERGYDFTSNILGGENTVGTRAYMTTVDLFSGLRSIHKTVFSSQSPGVIATRVEVEWNGRIVKVNAKEDDRLSRLGIPVVKNQPGVGEYLQNYLMSILPTHLKVEGIAPGIKVLAHETSESIIRSFLRGPDVASVCLLLSVIPGVIALLGVILSFSFSCGSTHIIIVRHVQNLHKLTMYPALQSDIQPTEVPQDMEVIKEMLRESAALTTHHTCGTVAMLPRRVEGVVDQDLLVYRTKNMRVSIAIVYVVAEKGADVIQSS